MLPQAALANPGVPDFKPVGDCSREIGSVWEEETLTLCTKLACQAPIRVYSSGLWILVVEWKAMDLLYTCCILKRGIHKGS